MSPAALTTAAVLAVPVLICVSVAGTVAAGVVEAWPVRRAGAHRKPAAPEVSDETVPLQVGRWFQ